MNALLQCFHALLKRRVCLNGLAPDLKCERRGVNVVFRNGVKAVLLCLIEEAFKHRSLLLCAKELIVRAKYDTRLVQALNDARAELEYAIKAAANIERIDKHDLGLLANTVNATRSLHKPDRCPGKVVVHHDSCVLKVLAFREDVCGNEDADLLLPFGHAAKVLVRVRAKPARVLGWVLGRSRDGLNPLNPTEL